MCSTALSVRRTRMGSFNVGYMYIYMRAFDIRERNKRKKRIERASKHEAACLFEWTCFSPYFGHFAKTRYYYYYYIVLTSIEIDVEYFHLSRPNSFVFVESVSGLHTLPLLYYHFCLVHTAILRTPVIKSLADDDASNRERGDQGHLTPKLTRMESNIRWTDIYILTTLLFALKTYFVNAANEIDKFSRNAWAVLVRSFPSTVKLLCYRCNTSALQTLFPLLFPQLHISICSFDHSLHFYLFFFLSAISVSYPFLFLAFN